MTYNPASFICAHVAVHLHTLAGVPVDVNGVDATQCLAVQQVLGTVLRSRKQSTPWRKAQDHTWQVLSGALYVCQFEHIQI